MKKIGIIVVIIVVLGGIWWLYTNQPISKQDNVRVLEDRQEEKPEDGSPETPDSISGGDKPDSDEYTFSSICIDFSPDFAGGALDYFEQATNFKLSGAIEGSRYRFMNGSDFLGFMIFILDLEEEEHWKAAQGTFSNDSLVFTIALVDEELGLDNDEFSFAEEAEFETAKSGWKIYKSGTQAKYSEAYLVEASIAFIIMWSADDYPNAQRAVRTFLDSAELIETCPRPNPDNVLYEEFVREQEFERYIEEFESQEN